MPASKILRPPVQPAWALRFAGGKVPACVFALHSASCFRSALLKALPAPVAWPDSERRGQSPPPACLHQCRPEALESARVWPAQSERAQQRFGARLRWAAVVVLAPAPAPAQIQPIKTMVCVVFSF